MEADVRPTPPPDELEALEQALGPLLGASNESPASTWWQEGVRENFLDEEDA